MDEDLESIVEGLIETKLRRLEEEFHLEIEQLKAENKKLNADNKMLNDKIDQLLPLNDKVEEFKRQIERLNADNEMLKENEQKQEKLIRKLLNERENDAIASTTGFCRQNIEIF